MKKCVWYALLLAFPCFAVASIGTWRNHTSMKNVRDVARSGELFWAATSGGLFAWKAGTSEFQRFTNAEGLRKIDLTAVAVDTKGNIWSGTSTGTIHVYSPSLKSWRYILDIEADDQQTNKRINKFVIRGDTVLICTDFGLSLYDNNRLQFGDTYKRFGSLPASSRVAVYDAVIHGGSIWAAVGTGPGGNYVAVASLSNPNLLPAESWTLQPVDASLAQIRSLDVLNGSLYAGTGAGLYVLSAGVWTGVASVTGSVVAMESMDNMLALCTAAREVLLVDASGSATPFGTLLPFTPTSVTFDVPQQPAVGTENGGIVRFGTSWESTLPNGPHSNQFISICVDPDGALWGASGYNGNGTGFYKYNGSVWQSFTIENSGLPTNDYFRVSVGCNGSVWASSWGGGVVEIPRGAEGIGPENIYGRNVGMIGLTVNPDYIVTSTVQCDRAGSTWLSVLGATDKNILAVRRSDNTWSTMPAWYGSTRMNTLLDNIPVDRTFALDMSGNLWAASRDDFYKGVLSFGNRATDTVRVHLSDQNGLPSNDIKTIVIDRENDLWIGTDRGIAIVLTPENPTGPNGIATYRPLNGLVINSIAVDALNQKWVGTTEGAVLLSQDGTQLLASYTVESTGGRLIDNDVKSIAIDNRTGTVYFGTANGLASLTTTSAAPAAVFNGLSLSPNPYILPNAVSLTIDGLVENSSIKILSVDGRLVRNMTTPGGRIGFWDGKDDAGNSVPTGVYLVVAFSDDGSEVATGKVAVVRR